MTLINPVFDFRYKIPWCGLAFPPGFQLAPKTTNRGSAARGSGTKRRPRRPRNGGDSVGAYLGDAWSLAKRTATGLNEIRKLINIEEKVLDKDQTSFAFDTTGTVVSISSLVQGTDYNQRVGDSLKMQQIQFRYRVFRSTAATTSVVRIMLVRDLDAQGTLFSPADLLQSVGTAQAPTSPLKWLNRKRFAVLYDNLTTVTSTDIGFSDSVTMAHEGHILYLTSGTTSASLGKGSLAVYVVSDEATNQPSIAFQTRIVFTDD